MTTMRRICTFLQIMLKHEGYDVLMAGNGVDALDLARHTPPDIIISDILMPVMDGFALVANGEQTSV